jgi:hypothetical protein
MIDLLVLMLVNSLFICGLHISVCWDGMILAGAKKRLDTMPAWIKKPLYDCPVCMASVHSTYFFWLAGDCYFCWDIGPTAYWITLYAGYVVALAGLNALIYRHIE